LEFPLTFNLVGIDIFWNQTKKGDKKFQQGSFPNFHVLVLTPSHVAKLAK